MKLGLLAGYSPATMNVPMDLIKHVEGLGYDSVWTAEAWGSDAVTPATWILAQTEKIKVGTAIMQMPARTPAMTAMTAMTLYAMSEGRFILGLGPSGPQVVEGWHGVAYGRPLTRTKEYISIIRSILAREERLTHEGFHYQIPFKGEGSSGLGKPLKSILHGDPALQIYTASISSAGMKCAGEVSDGVFPVWMNPDRFDVFEDDLVPGRQEAGGCRGHTGRTRGRLPPRRTQGAHP
jgi:F420-dependent oxidoreductase-like protein